MVIQVLNGPERGKTFELKVGENRIGRSPRNEIVIDDSHTSGSHATLTLSGSRLAIRDHSRNGTLVNGAKVAESELRPGDRITVGIIHLQVRAEDSPLETETVVAEARERTRIAQSPAGHTAPPEPKPKKEDSGPYRTVEAAEAATAGATQKPEPDKPGADAAKAKKQKVRRLVLVGLLTLVTVIAIGVFTMPKPKRRVVVVPEPSPGRGAEASDFRDGKVILIADAWQELSLVGMAPEVRQRLERGKELYDRKAPGNLYNAAEKWAEAYRKLDGRNADIIYDCVHTARRELAIDFERDSSDYVVLSNRDDKKGAALKLKRITDDIPDHDDPRYRWAKNLLISGGYERYLQ